MKPTFLRRLAGGFVMAVCLGMWSAGVTHAQTQVEDGKLDSFVIAALTVQDLIDQWTPRIDGAENEEQAQQLVEEANTELAAAIEATDGITLDEYVEIRNAAQDDPALSADIAEKLEAKSTQ